MKTEGTRSLSFLEEGDNFENAEVKHLDMARKTDTTICVNKGEAKGYTKRLKCFSMKQTYAISYTLILK